MNALGNIIGFGSVGDGLDKHILVITLYLKQFANIVLHQRVLHSILRSFEVLVVDGGSRAPVTLLKSCHFSTAIIGRGVDDNHAKAVLDTTSISFNHVFGICSSFDFFLSISMRILC